MELDAEAKIRAKPKAKTTAKAKPKAKTTAKAKPKANPAASEDYRKNHYETIENLLKQLQVSLKMTREALGQIGDTREDTHQMCFEGTREITDILQNLQTELSQIALPALTNTISAEVVHAEETSVPTNEVLGTDSDASHREARRLGR